MLFISSFCKEETIIGFPSKLKVKYVQIVLLRKRFASFFQWEDAILRKNRSFFVSGLSAGNLPYFQTRRKLCARDDLSRDSPRPNRR